MITLRAKNLEFEVTYIDLANKPGWFLEISPHGKVPVLHVDDQQLFESNAIAEFLDEMEEPHLHPSDPIKRARNRAWTDFVPDFSKGLSGIYYTKSEEDFEVGLKNAPAVLKKLEAAIADERGNDGPYFNGKDLCLVDAAYAPFFQRFLLIDQQLKTGILNDFPLVRAWAEALMASDVVKGSVADSFVETFYAAMLRRGFYVGTLIGTGSAAAE